MPTYVALPGVLQLSECVAGNQERGESSSLVRVADFVEQFMGTEHSLNYSSQPRYIFDNRLQLEPDQEAEVRVETAATSMSTTLGA